jgi:hypothetical protein
MMVRKYCIGAIVAKCPREKMAYKEMGFCLLEFLSGDQIPNAKNASWHAVECVDSVFPQDVWGLVFM